MKISLPHVSHHDIQLVRQFVTTFICGNIHNAYVNDESYLTTLEAEVEDIKEQIHVLRSRVNNVKTFVLEARNALTDLEQLQHDLSAAHLQELLVDKNIERSINKGVIFYEHCVEMHKPFVNEVRKVFKDAYMLNKIYLTDMSQLAMRLVQQTFKLKHGNYETSYNDVNLSSCKLRLPHECIVVLSECSKAEQIQYMKLQHAMLPHTLTLLFFFALSMQNVM